MTDAQTDRGTPGAGLVLAIDAAPGVGSVALLRHGRVLRAAAVAMRASASGPKHDRDDGDPLMVAVAGLLSDAGHVPTALDGVACGAGPGGFTSLRISAAIAKGIAHATGCALLAGPSLGWAAAVRAPAAGAWLVTLDALRGERYVALAEVTGAVGQDDGAGARALVAYQYLGIHADAALDALVVLHDATGCLALDADASAAPIAAGAAALSPTAVDLASWEPAYGRLAEAQARWEAVHGPLVAAASVNV